MGHFDVIISKLKQKLLALDLTKHPAYHQKLLIKSAEKVTDTKI